MRSHVSSPAVQNGRLEPRRQPMQISLHMYISLHSLSDVDDGGRVGGTRLVVEMSVMCDDDDI